MFLDINWKKFNPLDVIRGCAEAYLRDFNTKPEEVKQVVTYRMKLCEGCALNKNGWCDTQNTIPHVETGIPTKGCGCNLKCKTALLKSSCPAAVWKAVEL